MTNCNHVWKYYTGLMEVFNYCGTCGIKESEQVCGSTLEPVWKQYESIFSEGLTTFKQCIVTSNGYAFYEHHDGSVQDAASGLVWYPELTGEFTHYQADAAAISCGLRLPTKQEFEEAEEHGIREVLDMKYKFFWSGSLHPDSSDYAYYFVGYDGDVGYVFRNYNRASVRCVGR